MQTLHLWSLTCIQPCFTFSVSVEARGVIQQSPEVMCTQLTADLAERKKAIKRLLTYFIVRSESVSVLVMGFCQVLVTPGDNISVLISKVNWLEAD